MTRAARIVAPAAVSPVESTECARKDEPRKTAKCEKPGFCEAQRNKKPPK